MTERERFIQEMKSKFGDLVDLRICLNGDGGFMAWDARVAFWAWQAAQQKESVDIDADQLSNFIRKIDGNNSMGAGALAEHIVGWLKTKGYPQQKEGYVLVPVEREKL